jgi:nickel transport system substrate-binding protein
MFAQAMVYEPLVRYGEGGKILPWLAETWEISPDGKVYTFTIRKNVRFSDGTPFDARAVKMNFDALVKSRSNHDWLEVIAQIKETEAVNSHNFRLHLKNSYYPVLQELCLVRPLRFLSPKAFPDNLDTAKGIKAPVGTGPWQLVESKKGEYDLFTVNENYWGTKPSFKKLLIKVIGDVLITVDETARQSAFRDILSTLHEQAVYLPLTYMTGIMVHRKELTNVRFGPTKNEIPFETMVRE